MHISAALQRVMERSLQLMSCAQQQPIHPTERQVGNNNSWLCVIKLAVAWLQYNECCWLRQELHSIRVGVIFCSEQAAGQPTYSLV